MKKYTFEIRSTCYEVIVVEASSKEEAIKKVKEGDHISSHIPESEFSEEISEDNITNVED